MHGIGHNNGPTLESGTGWRTHCWRAAREALLPTLPVEVVRLRVRRAAEIGLDYRTYASIRAASGHDVVAFLFSSNALHLLPAGPAAALPEAHRARLAAVQAAGRGALVQAPLTPADLETLCPDLLDHTGPAPRPFAPWQELRARVQAALETTRWPRQGVVMIGETGHERDWAIAARLGYYLPGARFFAT